MNESSKLFDLFSNETSMLLGVSSSTNFSTKNIIAFSALSDKSPQISAIKRLGHTFRLSSTVCNNLACAHRKLVQGSICRISDASVSNPLVSPELLAAARAVSIFPEDIRYKRAFGSLPKVRAIETALLSCPSNP